MPTAAVFRFSIIVQMGLHILGRLKKKKSSLLIIYSPIDRRAS